MGVRSAPAVTVDIEDQFNNVVTTSTAIVAMALATNPTSASLGGTTSIAAVNGVVTFINLTLNNVGSSYTLSATSAGLNSGTSASFNVTPAELTITAEQPDQGLRCGPADADGQLLRLRQRRHVGQPDDPADAHDDGHCRQPCRGQSLQPSPPAARSTPTTRSATSLARSPSPPAALTITANNQTKVYGAALPTLTASYSGFVNGDTSASLTTQPTLTHDGHRRQPLSRAAPTPSPPAARSTPTTRSATSPGPTVTTGAADDHRQQPDQGLRRALPTLTASYSGFVNGDTSASLTTQPTLEHDRHRQQPVAGSPYSITASGAVDTTTRSATSPAAHRHPGAADDHRRQPDQGLRRSAADADRQLLGLRQRRHLGQPDHPATLTTTATASSHVAGSPYTITASGAVDTDYTISYVAGTLTVTPAALTITADNQTKVYGAALPTLTASYSGFVNGDTSASLTTQPTLTTTATASSHVAGSPYTITASGAVDSQLHDQLRRRHPDRHPGA